MLALSIPAIQTRLAKAATSKINEEFNTNILVKKLDLSFLGFLQLKEIEIRDHHKDTLIFIDNFSTSILNAKRILDNELNLADVSLSGVNFIMKTYKGETSDNMSVFIENFEEKPKDSTSTPFVLTTENIYVDNLTYKLIDENKTNPLQFSSVEAGGNLQNFELNGPNVSTKIQGLYLTENNGISITNLTTDFTYTKQQMLFKNTTLETNNQSNLSGDIVFNYTRKDFKDFTNKVTLKANFKESTFSFKDLRKLYGELGSNDMLHFKGNVKGTLNSFIATHINVYSDKGMKIIGDLSFRNALDREKGFIFKGDLDNVTANYQQLKDVLPNLLGKTLPTDFKKLGTFTLSGLVKATPIQIDADIEVASEIGNINSNLLLTNIDNIDNAEYSGKVDFKNFDIGLFANDSILGKISLNAHVKGSGFKIDNINTIIVGNISALEFKGYNYQDLDVNGQFQNKKFDGLLTAKDKNLKMKFEGLADLSLARNKFDFKADIEKVDLKKTNLFTRDSIAVLRGKISLDINGNTFDDIVGEATFKDIKYTNQRKVYPFKKFTISSSIKDSIKTIKVTSKDIVDGKVEGKFSFEELFPMAQNALGSVYTNYNPNPVKPNQSIDFNFSIYNQIVEVFLPEVSLGKNTKIKGKIKSDNNTLKLTFSTPKINAYGVDIDKILMRMDNKNPLYNTHFTANKVQTEYYNINKLNLLNRTVNDTLYFKSVFKGGKENTENFNLDFYYTINPEKKSVVGVQKSTFNFNGFDWMINPSENKENKVAFNLGENQFKFSPFTLVSNEQEIKFKGDLGAVDKNLEAHFTQVSLKSFLPKIDGLDLKGKLNGILNLAQNNGTYSPEGNLEIKDFYINNYEQGNLAMQVKGENSYKKYAVDISLKNKDAKNISVTGDLDFSKNKPLMDLDIFFKKYDLAAFSPLGAGVLENLRGQISGGFTATGLLENPDFNGALNFENAGMSFPYLNVDYNLEGNTSIALEAQAFTLKDIKIKDTKHQTQGVLGGYIAHENFKKWFLDLNINTDNLLVLDTKEEEEVQYYGTGFLDGSATIQGLTSNLTIDVNGVTNPGTVFVIPLSDIKTINNYKLINFKSKEKVTEIDPSIDDIKGLDLNINLNVTKDALAQVVIDKISGSDLKGRGNGNLDIRINTRGKFLMNGDFEVEEGFYNFKYGGVVNKPFAIQKGGTISWNGSPFDAELDITAVYETKANPAQLLDNINSSRKIPIDLYTKITGGLFSSKQEFDIKIPNANSSVASELEFILNDNDLNTKMQHFVWLLVFDSFYNEDLGNSATSGLIGSTTEALSGIFSSILNDADSKIKLGVGYTRGDKSDINNNQIDDLVEVSASTQISDRVLVNGNVGVPVGANTQTSVVGEVTVEVLLNEQGNFRATIFNRQNEIQYSAAEEEGYTQGVGLSYQVNFNTFPELLQKVGLKKKKKPKKDIKKDTLFKKAKLNKFTKFNKKTKIDN